MSEHKDKKGLAAALFSALSVSVYGVSLLDNPAGFVAAAVMDLIIGWVLDGAGAIGSLLAMMWGQLTGAFTSAGGAASGAFTSAGDVVVDLIATLNTVAVGLAQGAGPFAPFLVVVVWAVVVYAAITLLSAIKKGVLWLT